MDDFHPTWLRETINWHTPPPGVRRAVEGLLAGPGWGCVLVYIAEQLQRQHGIASNKSLTDRHTYDAIGQQNALLDLLTVLYRTAEQHNPFEGARGIWLRQWMIDVRHEEEIPTPTEGAFTVPSTDTRRRHSSSVL